MNRSLQPLHHPLPRSGMLPRVRVALDGDPVARFGDRAGEYLRMQRGRFDAWIYVGFACATQALLVGGLVGGLASLFVAAVSHGADTARSVVMPIGTVAGVIAAWLTFRDRWRCVEAFSSRF